MMIETKKPRAKVVTIVAVAILAFSLLIPTVALAASDSNAPTQSQGQTQNQDQSQNNQNSGSSGDNQMNGNMGTPPDMGSGQMPDFSQTGGPVQGGGMNPLFLGLGIALIALALGFVGGFFVGKAIGSKKEKKVSGISTASPEPRIAEPAQTLPGQNT